MDIWSDMVILSQDGVLEQLPDDQLIYRFPKPQPDGCTQLRLTPLEFIERLAALIPPSCIHRHRHHEVLAPNAPPRAQVTAWARPATPPSPAPLPAGDPAQHAERSPARLLWALLLARIYEVLPLQCPLCAAPMRLIAFITEGPAVNTILRHLGEPSLLALCLFHRESCTAFHRELSTDVSLCATVIRATCSPRSEAQTRRFRPWV